jgi:uncharacterized protein (DUF2147 family)
MKYLLSVIAMIALAFGAQAQNNADDVVGTWLNGEGTGKIEIYKTVAGTYAGKIVWLKEPIDPETGKPKLDKRNPDKTKQTVATLGLINMKGFKFDTDDKNWTGGTIYDPKKGKTYSCKITMTNKNSIDVRGYIGISLLGRTDTWTKEVKK